MVRYCYECKAETQKSRCPECAAKHRARNKKSREANIETYKQREARERERLRSDEALLARTRAFKKKSRLKADYGITVGQYEEMLLSQEGLCYLCQKDAPLVVDHDHATGKVRGLLCRECNLALGFFYDNPQVMAKAITYVLKG